MRMEKIMSKIEELTVSSMPTDWWAWTGDQLIPLGICEDFDEADERASKIGTLAHWIFSRESLDAFVKQAERELA